MLNNYGLKKYIHEILKQHIKIYMEQNFIIVFKSINFRKIQYKLYDL